MHRVILYEAVGAGIIDLYIGEVRVRTALLQQLLNFLGTSLYIIIDSASASGATVAPAEVSPSAGADLGDLGMTDLPQRTRSMEFRGLDWLRRLTKRRTSHDRRRPQPDDAGALYLLFSTLTLHSLNKLRSATTLPDRAYCVRVRCLYFDIWISLLAVRQIVSHCLHP